MVRKLIGRMRNDGQRPTKDGRNVLYVVPSTTDTSVSGVRKRHEKGELIFRVLIMRPLALGNELGFTLVPEEDLNRAPLSARLRTGLG